MSKAIKKSSKPQEIVGSNVWALFNPCTLAKPTAQLPYPPPLNLTPHKITPSNQRGEWNKFYEKFFRERLYLVTCKKIQKVI